MKPYNPPSLPTDKPFDKRATLVYEVSGAGKLSQFGIAVALFGGVITFIGLFPGIMGLEASSGVGVLQTIVILVGFSILTIGAYVFAQSYFFAGVKHNLAQEIGVRLSATGLVLSTATGLADVLGFGSHTALTDQRPLIGYWQAAGMILGFVIASLGLVIFVLFGLGDTQEETPEMDDDAS
ncbi:MAG: hypothetical protein OHK0023_00410 [Anaerolineae bacterium]